MYTFVSHRQRGPNLNGNMLVKSIVNINWEFWEWVFRIMKNEKYNGKIKHRIMLKLTY